MTGHPDEPRTHESEEEAPLGGSETTEEQLEADIEVEEDTLRTLEGEAPTG